MELIIIISVEITGIKLLPKIREFNDVFLEVSAQRRGRRGRTHASADIRAAMQPWTGADTT